MRYYVFYSLIERTGVQRDLGTCQGHRFHLPNMLDFEDCTFLQHPPPCPPLTVRNLICALFLFPAGTAGIYQGANGLTSAAGFGSVHQVHPPVVVSVLSFKSPLKSGHPECLLLPLTPTRNPSLFFPGFGCHRGDCKWPLERYRVEAEKLDERGGILYYILTWAKDTPWLLNLECRNARCLLFHRPWASQGWKHPSVECPAHSGGFINVSWNRTKSIL